MKKTIYILLLVTLFASCEQDVDPKYYPETTKKAASFSFISADNDSIKLFMQWSKPLFEYSDYQYENIVNANVKIIGDKTYQLQYNYSLQCYLYTSNDVNLNNNDDLQLEISHNELEETIFAETKIPFPPKYEISYLNSTNEDEWSTTHNFQFKSLNQNKAYYLVEAYRFSNFGYKEKLNDIFFKSDKDDIQVLKFYTYNEFKTTKMYFNITNCDEHYYKYHKSVMEYNEGFLFTEPSQIYSNIDGGLGVFSSYITKVDSLEF